LTGTVINAGAIVIAGLLGLRLRKGIPDSMSRTMQDGLGILVLVIGLQYAMKADNLAVIGLSVAAGAVIGEWRQWEHRLELLGGRLDKLLGAGENQFVKGFVSASLLFCVGAMGIIGALEDGLTGNYQVLLVKAILDGIFSIIFAASMGMGVIFSAVPVFIYQGAISLAAGIIKPFMTGPMLNNITALGGLLIAGLGLNILGVTRIRIANLLPGLLFIPLVMYLLSFL
jgi:uncharacterized membrane protein YqgA involved in biofilm formation